MVDFDAMDEQLIHALQVDGRASFSRIGAVLGASDRTVARRYHRLREAGCGAGRRGAVEPPARESRLARPDPVRARLIRRRGRDDAHHPEIAFAAAVTGPTNLFAFVLCADADALYDYLATRIGTLAGITHIETAPLTTTVKRAGTVLPRR